ncbi:MAG: O-antigen ligase family protein [Bacteroides sp.]|nr:O-antigen ligase family protein [Alistipes timonensis]MCM1311106.1 O-antigen ligase family protein [Bacteroides sp.]MCM1404807.1 O-antigen ligase family protein [[Clostridium] fimetarium]
MGAIVGFLTMVRVLDAVDLGGFAQSLMMALATMVAVTASFLRGERFRINYWLLAFLGACALSLIVMRPVPLGTCWMRFAGFVVGLAALSPLAVTPLLNEFRRGAWNGLFAACVLITLTSFAMLCYAVATSSTAEYHHFGFRGIMKLGMALSPVAALSAILSLHKMLTSGCSCGARAVAWAIVCVISVITAVAAGSRIAVAGLVCAAAILMVVAWRKGSRQKVVLALSMMAAVGLVSVCVPAVRESVSMKNALSVEAGSPFSSRIDRWTGRLAEFESAPLTGIGFSAQTVFNSEFDDPESVLAGSSTEPGSSWLSLLAHTGLIGTIAFIAFWGAVLKHSAKHPRPFLLAVLSFLVINGICEGWLLFSGALMFPFFWILTSILND